MTHKYQKPELYFLLMCIALALVLLLGIFQSFLGSFVFATIFSASLLPLHKKLISKLKISSKVSAAFLVFALTITLLYPLTFILTNSYQEVMGIINSLNENNPIILPTEKVNQPLSNKIHHLITHLTGYSIPENVFYEKWHQLTQTLADQILYYINYAASNAATFIFNFMIFILTTYVILTKGEKLKTNFFKLSLLPERDEEYIVRKFENLNRVLLLGNTIGGTIQSLVGFILMSFMGLEKIFFWSLLIMLFSFVPVVGSALVFIPMSLYLWFMGKKALAIIMISIMGVTFLAVENWFKPKFIGGRVQMHSLVILFSMLGGVKFFGTPGIFYGPIITTLFLSLMELYNKQADNAL